MDTNFQYEPVKLIMALKALASSEYRGTDRGLDPEQVLKEARETINQVREYFARDVTAVRVLDSLIAQAKRGKTRDFVVGYADLADPGLKKHPSVSFGPGCEACCLGARGIGTHLLIDIPETRVLTRQLGFPCHTTLVMRKRKLVWVIYTYI